jgi:hypothetical protein
LYAYINQVFPAIEAAMGKRSTSVDMAPLKLDESDEDGSRSGNRFHFPLERAGLRAHIEEVAGDEPETKVSTRD